MLVNQTFKDEAVRFIGNHHYSPVMPPITKFYLGAFQEDDEMVGVITLGWGTRPLHTIKKLFPDLKTQDYLEIGKMCMSDKMPRNSESQFLSAVVKWMKCRVPNVKFLFTWADGMVGKPGYVYQASNFWYGGYIWTDSYMTSQGEKVHPRRYQTQIGHRPDAQYIKNHNLRRFEGKQFRYIYPLNRKAKKMLSQSTVNWSQQATTNPKSGDLKWREITDAGKRICEETPPFDTRVVDMNASNVGGYLSIGNSKHPYYQHTLEKFFSE